MDITVSQKYSGLLVRDFLRRHLGISRSELTELKKKDDGILLNGNRVTVRAVLRTNDVLSLNRSDESFSEGVIPVELPLDVLYEDNDIIALNKPANMPTHPSHDHQDDTLANALAFYFKKQNIPFVFRAVNRLDRDTSGIVLVAKNKASAFYLSREFSSFNVTKQYVAIAVGIANDSGMIEKNIERAEASKIKRRVCDNDNGQYALTEYEKLEEHNGNSVLLVTPKTGRTHQIRVHLSYIGHPIISDTLYGDESPSLSINRQSLHAYALSFKRPSDGNEIKITAPPPSDMLSLMSADLRDKLCKR